MTHLEIQAMTTATSTGTGTGVDISGITGAWTVVVEVFAANPANTFRIQLTDTVNNFGASTAGPSVSGQGQIGNVGATPIVPAYSDPKRWTFKQADYPDLRFGVGSAKLRADVTALDGGSSQSLTYHVWVEY